MSKRLIIRLYSMPQPGVVISDFIAIDKFPKNAGIEYYFLTHAHSDHYGAVDNKWNNGTIYCSPVTAHVLPIVTQRSRSKRAGIQSRLIHALDLNVWHHMDGFSVMLLDANHIPGSVMFLFEGDRIPNGRILFTGDFRADIRLYENVFAISVLQEIRFNTIYLDTTYINCTREEFPSREASLAELYSVLRQLLFNGSKPVTIMVPKIGREQLLVDIAIEFKCKVWVDNVRFQIAEVLGLSEYFTTEIAETSIWTSTRQNIRSVLYDANVHVIDISMLRHVKPNSIINDERILHVEYSDHSSPNELRGFLSQLSFSQVIGLSVQLSQKQTEEFERLSLMDFSDTLMVTETNESIVEDEVPALTSAAVRSRIELASDRALRNVFDVEILQHTTDCDQNQELIVAESRLAIKEENTNIGSIDTILKSNTTVKNLKILVEAVDDGDDYIFDLAMRKITRADYTNLTTRVCMELNNNENTEEDNPLYEFWNEVDFSKQMENLGSLSEKYREAVDILSKMRIVRDINLSYSAQDNVVYDASRAPASLDIPLEWLNESEPNGVIASELFHPEFLFRKN
uniref:5' exonuclease Apollo n=1 Tax=Elaeophora elaphi TaxID=1147741 RepID=A0A0R3RSZ6_9BILA